MKLEQSEIQEIKDILMNQLKMINGKVELMKEPRVPADFFAKIDPLTLAEDRILSMLLKIGE